MITAVWFDSVRRRGMGINTRRLEFRLHFGMSQRGLHGSEKTLNRGEVQRRSEDEEARFPYIQAGEE